MAAPRSYVRFAALGDSVTYGLGDRASKRSRGWARLLGEAIARDHHVSYCNLAHPGATAADLRTKQLSEALDHRPHVASLIIGLNDTMRSTWDCATVRADLLHAASCMAEQGALLLTVRFHDHSRVFGLPGFLARLLRQRIEELNATYDEIHQAYGGLQVDLASHPGVYDREFWSIDRLHPSELGHRALAHEFSARLDQYGLTFDPPALELDGDPTTRLGELRTLAVDGVPWVARRVRDLGPGLGRRPCGRLFAGDTPRPFRAPTCSPPDEVMTLSDPGTDPSSWPPRYAASSSASPLARTTSPPQRLPRSATGIPSPDPSRRIEPRRSAALRSRPVPRRILIQRKGEGHMSAVIPQNERYLRDAFGSRLHDGACVLDADHQVGYIRLEFGNRAVLTRRTGTAGSA